jgi:type II secretory ATPase GspE/PulE/Tfp pilus assembly ATPase PilB-like protein
MKRVSLQDRRLPSGDAQFSLGFMESHGLVKLSDDDVVEIGAVSEPGPELVERLKFSLGRPFEFLAIDKNEFSEYISRCAAEVGNETAPTSVDDENLLDRLANDAPVINLVNSILMEGLRLRCSDIHLEGHPEGVRVRFRVDGALETARMLPKDMARSVSSRIKVMSNLNIIERRLPQDGKMNAVVGDRSVEFRVSIVPTIYGESIVLRLFDREEERRDLGKLGFDEAFLASLRRVMRFPHGLVLVTGPTGSGKTTTLNAVLAELNRPDVKILTVEDPVENRIPGICQVQTNDEIGMSFDSILRRLLRQDPDILMIGEIRDKATAELALRSALTGHQVWATLHTNDALSSVDRLVNMGLEPYLLAAVLRAVIAQRLVRRLCPSCSGRRAPTRAEAEFLAEHRSGLDDVPFPKACSACSQGYRGRVAIGEIFLFDDDAQALVVGRATHRELTRYFREAGSPFLAESGMRLIAQGATSVDEVEKVLYGL